ncbi:sulfide/dihydroorotate dehydrogenase-like FAD/NAD-binding protein [Candidatus Bathyarchaeota archaeon]|nr:sulfide/dihydroorotate dehydrogenase-like FAD/NAD-binding protein [Candidatus Bathyarchaeota archaeon]
MTLILEKKEIGPKIKSYTLLSPLIAKKQKPGQFLVVRASEQGERIPLTIADADPQEGTIRIVFQEVGRSTKHLGKLNQGQEIMDVVGPLGQPSRIELFGTVIIAAGGVGIAEAYPIAKALRTVGNRVITILGARNKELFIMLEEIAKVSNELFTITDDGSSGKKGLVTDQLKELLERGIIVDKVITIGPTIMMKAVSELTKKHSIPTMASLNPIMIDATGMCGCCRVSVGGETKFTCVDGPEFDAHKVNFDQLISRLNMYKDGERIADHKCKLEN